LFLSGLPGINEVSSKIRSCEAQRKAGWSSAEEKEKKMIDIEGKRYRGISRRHGAFIFRYTDPQGREHRVKCETLHEAFVLYHTKRDLARKGGMPAPRLLRRKKLTFAEIAQDALTYSKQSKRSYRTDVPRFAKLKECFGKRVAETITPKEIEEGLGRLAELEVWAASTFNHYRSLISLAYRLAIRDRGFASNPARSVPHRRENNSRVRFLSEDEELRLRNVLTAKYCRHLPEFDLALHTGLRQGSQYGLTWEMVDWNERMLHIPRTKNEEPLHIPLNDAALAALKRVRARSDGTGRVFRSERTGEPLEHPRHWFEPAIAEAKITDFHWHDLRHTFASRLRMKGAPLEDIADLLGQKTLAMAKRYAHLGPSRLHQLVSRLVPGPKSGAESGTGLSKLPASSVIKYVN
jgi:site-specific recombinase XerD